MSHIGKILFGLGIVPIVFLLNCCLAAHAEDPLPGSWPMFHYDAARTGFNPNETALYPPLQLCWIYTSTAGVDFSPVISGGVIYAKLDGGLTALSLASGTVLWRNWHWVDGIAVYGDKLYASYWDYLYAFEAQTGEETWSYQAYDWVGCYPAVTDGRVYFTSYDRSIYALDAEDGSLVWKRATLGRYYKESPSIYRGKLFAQTKEDNKFLYGLNALTGDILWQVSYHGRGEAPAVAHNTVYEPAWSQMLRAFNADDGADIWTATITSTWNFYSSPAVAYNTVYMTADDGLYAFDATSGAQKWVYNTPLSCRSSPAVANGVVYFGCDDNFLRAVNAYTGELLWGYETGYQVRSSPAIAEGYLVVGSDDRRLYCFNSSGLPPLPNKVYLPLVLKGE